MKDLTRDIREATGLQLSEYCEKNLDTDHRKFGSRRLRNSLYPNEVLLICLHTGKNPMELFGMSALDIFFLRGKSKRVNKIISELLKRPGAIDKLNLILGNPEGLRFTTLESPGMPRQEKPKKPGRAPVVKPLVEKKVEQDNDWMSENVFR